MKLNEVIYQRKSNRKFESTSIEKEVLEDIEQFISTVTPLYKEIKTESVIVGKDQVKTILPWKAPHNLVIFSEEKDGYMENVGFIYQQVDLYIQSKGLGSCWIGMGKLASKEKEEVLIQSKQAKMKFVIFITFGKVKDMPYRQLSEFKRKSFAEIANQVDERLEPARLAPSSNNSQPWYFVHGEERIDVYCKNPGFLKSDKDSSVNRLDIGCALAHLFIANPNTFQFSRKDSYKEVTGYYYIGSVKI